MAKRKCYGYTLSPAGELEINPDEVNVVHWIFERYLVGDSLGEIAVGLERLGIPSPTGKPIWSREAINKLLSNEKYTGDVLLQKTFVKDVLTGKQFKNQGELEQYLIQQHHPMIMSRELFERVNPNTQNSEPLG